MQRSFDREKSVLKGFKKGQKPNQINFGDCIYFLDSKRIERGNQFYTLPQKAAKILEYLIENQGRSVTRHEIVEAVWDNPEVVTSQNFYTVIGMLRKTLGDTNEPRQYIENPSKNIYLLKPKVILNNASAGRVGYFQAAGLVAVISIAATISWVQPSSQPATYKGVDDRIMTTLKGQVERAVTSPDGSIIVFPHKSPGSSSWNLKAVRVGTEEYANFVIGNKHTYVTEPDFSPSGQRLVWVESDFKTRCQVLVADFDPFDMTLGQPEKVLNCSLPLAARSPRWKTENNLLLSLSPGENQPGTIYEIDLTTHERYKITSVSGKRLGDYSLAYDLQSYKVAYIREATDDAVGSIIRVYDFGTKKDTFVKAYPYLLYSIAWVNGQKLLVKGDTGFEVVALDGQTHSVDFEDTESKNFIFSLRNDRFGFVKGDLYARDIYEIDLVNKTQDGTLSSVNHEYRAVIAKESDEIAFVSTRYGNKQIFLTNNKVPVQLTHFKTRTLIFDMAISSDGELIAFTRNNQLNVLDKNGKILYQKSGLIVGISFSPDGKDLFFGIDTETDRSIKRLNLSDFIESSYTEGFMPKATNEGDVYFFRQLEEFDKPVLHKITPEGGVLEMFEIPFDLTTSNSFDVMHGQLFYVKRTQKGKLLVKHDLVTGDVTSITPITSSKFSLNQDLTKLVTSKSGQVQNNLSSFHLVMSRDD